jgi:nucleoside-diphosphate-sugar epimerase
MSSSPHQRIAIIGATGQIGSVLSRSLLELGHSVIAISRGRSDNNRALLEELAAKRAELAFANDLSSVQHLAELLWLRLQKAGTGAC